MKRFVFVFLLIIIFTFNLIGCGSKEKTTPKHEITLQLAGFPYTRDSFYLMIYQVKGSGDQAQITQVHKLGYLDADGEYTKKILVNDSTTSLSIYLTESEYSTDACYVIGLPLKVTQSIYTVLYWLDYYEYFNNDRIFFGLSNYFLRDIECNVIETADFNDAPYYLYKSSYMHSQFFTINISAVKGISKFYCGLGDYIDGLDYPSIYNLVSSTYSQQIENYYNNYIYCALVPDDYDIATTATLNIDDLDRTLVSGRISDMVSGNSSDIIYALNKDQQILYVINPITETINKELTLPDENPIAMSFSALENKLYIISETTGSITVVDTTNDNITKIDYSVISHGVDIEVASTLNRLYILTSGGLYIYDLDTEEFCLSEAPIAGDIIALDEINKKLYTGLHGGRELSRYNVESDSLILEQNENIANDTRKMVLSPDKTKIILLDSIYNVNDFSRIGQWDLNGANFISCSPDGSLLYEATNEFYLCILDAQDYSQIRTLPFPNTNNSWPIFTTNKTGSVLVGFSYNINYNNNYYLYYFTNIQKKKTKNKYIDIHKFNQKYVKILPEIIFRM